MQLRRRLSERVSLKKNSKIYIERRRERDREERESERERREREIESE